MTCEYEDVAPETGFRGNFEEVGRAFGQANKEGWRLTKEGQSKNETHQGYVQGEGAVAGHSENCLGPLEDFWGDDEGGCTDLKYRSPCEHQGGDVVKNKCIKSRSKQSRGVGEGKNQSENTIHGSLCRCHPEGRMKVLETKLIMCQGLSIIRLMEGV